MKDDLINRLASNLTPARSLQNWHLWRSGGMIFLASTVFVIMVYRVREDLAVNMLANMVLHPMIILKSLYFLILGAVGIFAIKGLSRPVGHIPPLTLGAIIVLICLLFGEFLITLLSAAPGEFAHQMTMPFGLCVATIIIGGMAAWGVLWAMWLRRCASQWPKVLGGLSAFTCAGLVASAYALHCNMDSPIYIVVFYLLPVIVVTIFGAILGGRLLRW